MTLSASLREVDMWVRVFFFFKYYEVFILPVTLSSSGLKILSSGWDNIFHLQLASYTKTKYTKRILHDPSACVHNFT